MTRQPYLLLVEDDESVGEALCERISSEGFLVRPAKSVASAMRILFEYEGCRLALLDVGLPDGSGFDIAKKLASFRPRVPVMFMTAYGAPDDRLKGLELGGEDYIVKPFHWRELFIRIQNVLKRFAYIEGEYIGLAKAKERVEIGLVNVDFMAFSACDRNGNEHHLSQKECALLRYLWSRRGEVVSRDEILDFVWSVNEYPSPRTVDNFVVRLRRMIEENPDAPQVIKSIRGVGYQLVTPGLDSSSSFLGQNHVTKRPV